MYPTLSAAVSGDPSTWGWLEPEQVLATTSVLTVIIVAVAGRIAYLQLRNASEQRAEEQRPFVVIDVFGSRTSIFRIEVKNIGKTIAKNVRFSFDPPLTSSQDKPNQKIQNIPILARGLPSLAPGKKHNFLLDSARTRTRADYPDTYDVIVRYDGYDGTEYDHPQVLDLGAYWNTPDLRERDIHDIWHSMEKMNQSLHGINASLGLMAPTLPGSTRLGGPMQPNIVEGPPQSIEGGGFPHDPEPPAPEATTE